MAYVRPQLQVFQEFRQAPQNVVQNLNAFIFGPNYQLFRFAESAEKNLIGLGTYDKTTDTVFSYPNKPSGSTVDVDFAQLFAEDVLLRFFSADSARQALLVLVMSPILTSKREFPPISGW